MKVGLIMTLKTKMMIEVRFLPSRNFLKSLQSNVPEAKEYVETAGSSIRFEASLVLHARTISL